MREKALLAHDRGQYAALTADLARQGWTDPPLAFETAVPEPMEHAVPKKGGRPKLPRCEHDRIVGRCTECDEEV